MTTQTLVKKLDKAVAVLQKDVEVIKKIVTSTYFDPEGEYKKGFVKKVLTRAKEKPKYRFTTREVFLKDVYGKKK